MQYMHAQLEIGTIAQRIENEFGQWFLHGNDTMTQYIINILLEFTLVYKVNNSPQ